MNVRIYTGDETRYKNNNHGHHGSLDAVVVTKVCYELINKADKQEQRYTCVTLKRLSFH